RCMQPAHRRGGRPAVRVQPANCEGPRRPPRLRRSGAPPVRALGRVVLLVMLWLLAWGEVTLANVVSGVAVAAALLLAFPPARRTTPPLGMHPVAVARLTGYVFLQLVTSNVVMTREILRRRPAVQPG